MHRPLRPAAACVLALSLAAGAGAADLYTAGSLAISGGGGDASGDTPFFSVSGSDFDSSPAYGGALGLGFALAEASPSIWGIEMPDWTFRFELEGLGGRDYELFTDGGDGFVSNVDAWSLLSNVWLDVPLDRPLARLFGGEPLLAPLSVYAGGGIGLAHVDVRTTDNVSHGSSSSSNFAWQVGGGLGYQLTPFVTLQAGYRYVAFGEVETSLSLVPGSPFGSHALDLRAHEFVSSLRVAFHSRPLDELIPRRWSLPWRRHRF